jgi:hypothetical protein
MLLSENDSNYSLNNDLIHETNETERNIMLIIKRQKLATQF